jgi:ribonuclease P protein component
MQRLKTRPQFQAVLGGELVAKTSHFAMHRISLDVSEGETDQSIYAPSLFPLKANWLGAMTPKRWAKRAVTRNAIKRQIYTVSASLTPPTQPAAFLVRLRREFSRKDYSSASSVALKEAVRAELLLLLQSAWIPSKLIAAST